MLAFFVVFVRQLINNRLPLLKQLGRSRDDGLWNLAVLAGGRLTRGVLGDHVGDVAGFEVFLVDWESVENTEDTLNHLDWRVAVVGITLKPHLKKPTAVIHKKHLLDVLLVHEIRQLINHLEPVHSRLTSLDCIVVAEADGVHFLDQTNCLNLALLVKLFFCIDGFGQFLRKRVTFPKRLLATTL